MTDLKPSFDTLYDQYSQEIFRYIWRMVRSTQNAEDCFQETFLRAYKAYPRLAHRHPPAPPTNYRAWFYTIATNVARTFQKRQSRSGQDHAELTERLSNTEPSVSQQVEWRLLLETVFEAVQNLPTKQRAALFLRKYQNLAYTEIANILDISPESARANVYQAIKKLTYQVDQTNHTNEELNARSK